MPRLPYSHCVWKAISCFAFLIEESLTFFSSKEQGKVAAIGGVQNTCGCSWISTKLPTLPHYALLFIFLMGLFLKKWPLSTFIGDFLPQNILFFFHFSAQTDGEEFMLLLNIFDTPWLVKYRCFHVIFFPDLTDRSVRGGLLSLSWT